MGLNMTLISLIILAIFFVVIGVYHRFTASENRGGGERVGLGTIAAALFVVVGSGEYDLSITMISAYGWAGLSFLFGLAFAFVLISIFTGTIFRHRASANMLYRLDGFTNFTTPDYIGLHHGRVASLISTVVVSICFFGLYILQVYVGGQLLSAAAGISVPLASALIAVTVVCYAVAGGFYSLFRTDLFQAIFMYGSLIIATLVSITLRADTINFAAEAQAFQQKAVQSLSISGLSADPTIIALFLLTVCAAFAGADLWQRVNVASTARSAAVSLVQGALALAVFSVILYIFAIDALSAMNGSGVDYSDGPFVAYALFVQEGSSVIAPWPPILIAVFAVGLLSAFVSTADTCLLLAASSIQNELHRWRGVGVTSTGDGSGDLNTRITYSIVTVLGLVGLAFSLGAPGVVDTFLAVLGALAVLGVPVLATLLGFGRPTLVVVSVLLGLMCVIFVSYIQPAYNEGWGLLIPCLPGFLCFLGRRKNSST